MSLLNAETAKPGQTTITPGADSKETTPLENRLYPEKTAEQLAADKVVSDKVAADKAAADKLVTDNAAAAAKADADKVIADKAAADKIAADKLANPDAVKYELKAPENSKFTAERLKEVEAFAVAHKLNPAQAQEILNREAKSEAASELAQFNRLEAKKVEWEALTKADPEIGGEKLTAILPIAQQGYKLAPPVVIEFLEASGLGSHPELIKFFYKIGKSGMADTMAATGLEAFGEKKTLEQRMYPKMA